MQNATIHRVAASKVSKSQGGRSATSMQWIATSFFSSDRVYQSAIFLSLPSWLGGGAVSTEPPRFSSFYDFPEHIVNEKGDWTCHANSYSIVARCEPYAPPNTGSCTRRQKSRDSSRASRLFTDWLLFHTVTFILCVEPPNAYGHRSRRSPRIKKLAAHRRRLRCTTLFPLVGHYREAR